MSDFEDLDDILTFAPPITTKCKWCGQPLDRYGVSLPVPPNYNPRDPSIPMGEDICEMCSDIQNVRVVQGMSANNGVIEGPEAGELIHKLAELAQIEVNTDTYLETLHFKEIVSDTN